MVVGGAITTRGVLATQHILDHLLSAHARQLTHEVHGCQPPVYATDTQELCDAVLLRERVVGGEKGEGESERGERRGGGREREGGREGGMEGWREGGRE